MSSKSKRDAGTWSLAILAIILTLFVVACGSKEPQPTLAPDTPEPAVQESGNAAGHLDAAAAYYAAGDYDGAIGELEQAVELEPDNAEAYTNLALSYFKNGDYENAVATWTKVIALAPDQTVAYFERGTSYFNLKKYEQAIADFTQAIDMDPANADAYRIRGKSYAFTENYELAIADFTRTIELDPASDEAYLNRAISTTKVGGTASDLAAIIADYGMAPQISENPDIRQQAQTTLETFLENSDDPVLRRQATDALQGIVATGDTPVADAEPSLMDIDVNRAPGHSIGFEEHLDPSGAQRFLFLASPGDTIGASISSTSAMRIGIQNANTGEILGVVPNNDTSLLVTIPTNALYYVVIEDAGGQGGDYAAAFEASPKVSFALNPNYFIVGRLPEGGLLYYTYTAPGGATLQGNVIPHPDTPVDLVVKILDLESQTVLYEANTSGPGENEQFTFTVPDNGDGKLLTYIVSVEDVSRNKGAYILAVTSDAADIGMSPVESPESVVQAVFDAATSGDFGSLGDLCDPVGENDDDTQMICDTATDGANRDEFVQYFASGKVNGVATISPDGTEATVPLLFGPGGDDEETMTLINRDGQWYLYSF